MHGISRVRNRETLGENDLKDIARPDELLGILHRLFEGLPGEIACNWQRGSLRTCREGRHG